MGSTVLAAEGELSGVAGTQRPPTNWRAWVLGVTMFAVFAAGLGYVVGNEIQANTQFDQAHASLNLTRSHVDRVLSDLSSVRQDLSLVNHWVDVDTTALAQDTARLKGAQAALAQAQAHVSQQGASINDLRTCLGGVEQSLNALSVGDLSSAISQLKNVSGACQSVAASSG